MAGYAPAVPKVQFFTSAGVPLVSGTLTVYLAGTTTPTSTWQDAALTTLNTNPITLDARGEAVIWLDDDVSYKFLLKDAAGATVWTVDNVRGTGFATTAFIADLINNTDSTKGAGLIGFGGENAYPAGTVGNLLSNALVSLAAEPWGVAGDGVTDDTVAIQACLDEMESRGGGTVYVPWTAAGYLITDTILIPDNVTLMGLGATSIIAGGQQFTYTGTDAAFALKNGESTTLQSRGVNIHNIGVALSTAGATGFRFRRCRDLYVQGCSVNMDADSQIGFHLNASRDGATYKGIFDCTFVRLASYSGDTHTAAIHYKLSGTASDGQVNACTFLGIRGGGAGKGIEVGPSIMNSFYGMEFEALTGDFIHCKSDADQNVFRDLYTEAQAAWASKILNCDVGATFNHLDGYDVGANVIEDEHTLRTNNTATHRQGDKYVPLGGRGWNLRVEGEDYRRMETRTDGIYYGAGTAEPTLYAGYAAQKESDITFSASMTPNLDTGQFFYVNVSAATNFTLNAPTNGYDGKIFAIEILNNSGSTRTITWNAAYIKNATLTTSLVADARYTVMFVKRGSVFVILGTPATMT
jgi:hypothetical protein